MTSDALSLAHFSRSSDDAEAEASLAADLDQARAAAAFLGSAEPFAQASTLLAAASQGLDAGRQVWALLDAADRLIADLRMEHGCEAWEAADWRLAVVQDLQALADEALTQRARARAQRDAVFTARLAG